MIDINNLKTQFERDAAAVKNRADAENLKVKYLGRKRGLLTGAFKQLAGFSEEEKKKLAPGLNHLRAQVQEKIQRLAGDLDFFELAPDLSLPASTRTVGHLHPLTQAESQLIRIFKNLGFGVEYGYEIENDWYNFTALNFPPNHPARDMQDTFFLSGQENKPGPQKLLLRTHTSPMQIRFMEKHKPPFAIIVPGTVYRNEATDATHEHTIQQLEGLVVGENINFKNMVWTIETVFKEFFGGGVRVKILPAYFPFVEPGGEIAMSSPKFQNGRWLEMGGCGMVHQKIFEASGYPKNKYQGFAFGFGSVRFPLMKHGIPDIRLLHENDLRFLYQF